MAHRSDPDYETLRGEIWNQMKPARNPELIIRVASDNDVVEAVRFARAEGMRVSVRGRGQNWFGSSLRDNGILVDLSSLRDISLDTSAGIATVQPGVTGRELLDRLETQVWLSL